MSRPTWGHVHLHLLFSLRGSHPLWRAFPCPSRRPSASSVRRCIASCRAPLPFLRNACRLSRVTSLGSSPFARRYSENHCCFLFLGVLRCFSSPGALPVPMDSVQDATSSQVAGSPIRIPPDHSLRTAPRGISVFAPSFVGIWRLGILRALLLPYPTVADPLASLQVVLHHYCSPCYVFGCQGSVNDRHTLSGAAILQN